MAKITLQSVLTGLASIAKLNTNFTAIAAEFQDKVLYRDNPAGEANQMESELDMNSNPISNVSSLEASTLRLGGSLVVPADLTVVSESYFWTPEQSGAVGDGVTDDTIAMQAALDYCLSTGKILQLGNKQYVASTLTIDRGASNKGPLIIQGHGAPQNFAAVLGSQIIQLPGSTGNLFTVTADWADAEYMIGILFRELGMKLATTSTGWAVDALNIINTSNGFSNVGVYCPGAVCAGAIRLNSCWGVSLRDVNCLGPNTGSSSRGIVMFGSTKGTNTSRGTSNQIVMSNIRANNFALNNIQIGKQSALDNVGEGTDGGGFLQSVNWTGGQAGSSSSGYGIVFGRCLDVHIDTVHTENNTKSGWYFDDDTNGTDCSNITLTNCDSYNDGDDGVYSDAPDRYGVQINRGKNIKLDDFRWQQSRFGLYVADSVEVDAIDLDRLHIAAHTSGGTTAINIANATPAETKRVHMGVHLFSGTWTNLFVNGGSIGWKDISFPLPADTATTSTLSVTPFTKRYTVSNSGATDLNTINWGTGYTVVEGTEITLVFTNANTTMKDFFSGGSANFRLAGGRDFTPKAYDSVTVRYRGTEWWEVSRSLNAAGHTLVTWTSLADTTLTGVTNLTTAVQVNHASAMNITSIPITSGKTFQSGQTIVVGFATANTTVVHNPTYINLLEGASWTPRADDQLILRYHAGSGAWYEVTRSYANSATQASSSGTSLTCYAETRVIRVSHVGATNVDTISTTHARNGQQITILFTNSNVDVVTGGNLKLAGGASFTTADTDDTITFVHYSGTWYETIRSSNS